MTRNESGEIESIVHNYLKPIYNFVYHLTGESEAATDITQETFIKVWKNLNKFDPAKNFKTWLFAIARNTTIDWLRKRKNLPLDDLAETVPDQTPLPEAIWQDRDQQAELERALEQLSLHDKTIILLHHQEELTFAAIAEIMSQPLNTVKSRYRRALIVLKKHLTDPSN